MSSRLMISGIEVNSKSHSRILIKAIRQCEREIGCSATSTPKMQNYFRPENFDEIDGELVGVGNWRISRKGMAYLYLHLEELYLDDERIDDISVKVDTEWCCVYVAHILAWMTLEKIKHVEVSWI